MVTPIYRPHIVEHHVKSHSGPMSAHLGLALHVQQGNNSPYHEFANPANEKSSTWWVSKHGVIEEFVPPTHTAWAQAEGNHTYNSVETEGFTGEELTLHQIMALAWLYRGGMHEYGWQPHVVDKPGKNGFITHGDGGVAWGNHPGCPGHLRAAERNTILLVATGQGCEPVGRNLRHEVSVFKLQHGLNNDDHIGSAVRALFSL
jgi:hypothetical protein